MIQRPASGTLDLELVELAHTGKKSVAFSTAAIFQHLENLLSSARLRPATAGSERPWLAGSSALRSGDSTASHRESPRPLEPPSVVLLQKRKSPELVGAFCCLMAHKKARLSGQAFRAICRRRNTQYGKYYPPAERESSTLFHLVDNGSNGAQRHAVEVLAAVKYEALSGAPVTGPVSRLQPAAIFPP